MGGSTLLLFLYAFMFWKGTTVHLLARKKYILMNSIHFYLTVLIKMRMRHDRKNVYNIGFEISGEKPGVAYFILKSKRFGGF
jgi:hypothetical protein